MTSAKTKVKRPLASRFLLAFGLIMLLGLLAGPKAVAQSRADRCNLKGRVFVEARRGLAQYSVFIEESEGLADVRIFKEDNALFADKSGKWHFVKTRGLADFTVFIEETKNLADFSIFYTETEAFAGCQ